jgi:transcriptional regulator with XRE-family HTH domain
MLVLARESRGLKQGDVAEAMRELEGHGSKVSQAYVSRAEAGRLTVSGDRLELYARALEDPPELLVLRETEVGAGHGLIHHRKKQAVAVPDLRRVHAVLNLTRIQRKGTFSSSPWAMSRCRNRSTQCCRIRDRTGPDPASAPCCRCPRASTAPPTWR